MVNKQILKNKGFTKKQIDIISKYYNYLIVKHIYLYNESVIFDLLEFINSIQKDVKLTFISNYVINFNFNNINIDVDLLASYL